MAKLTLMEISELAARQANPNLSAGARRLNNLLALQDMDPEQASVARSMGVDAVGQLADLRADEAEESFLKRQGEAQNAGRRPAV